MKCMHGEAMCFELILQLLLLRATNEQTFNLIKLNQWVQKICTQNAFDYRFFACCKTHARTHSFTHSHALSLSLSVLVSMIILYPHTHSTHVHCSVFFGIWILGNGSNFQYTICLFLHHRSHNKEACARIPEHHTVMLMLMMMMCLFRSIHQFYLYVGLINFDRIGTHSMDIF